MYTITFVQCKKCKRITSLNRMLLYRGKVDHWSDEQNQTKGGRCYTGTGTNHIEVSSKIKIISEDYNVKIDFG